MFSERLGMWKIDIDKKTSIKTFWDVQIESLKYLRLRKL